MSQILNDDVFVLPILIGNRLLDRRDFVAFMDKFCAKKGVLPLCYDYLGRKHHHFNKIMEKAQRKAEALMPKSGPVAIFLILTWPASVEAKRIMQFVDHFSGKRKDVFVYPIIWDGGDGDLYIRGITRPYLFESGKAAHIYFDSDAQTAGSRRVTEFIERVMGYDLPGQPFSRYSMDLVRKIARYINRENFNAHIRKARSIPKYPIINGKPYFPMLSVTGFCERCGREIVIDRSKLNEDGSAEVRCWPPCRYQNHFTDVGQSFDPWPEFDEYQKTEVI